MEIKCDVILTHLLKFLTQHFPSAAVLVLRGGNAFHDMTRMAYANQTFCSVSTYCFWPAVVSRERVYFPVTKLIAGGHEFKYHRGFEWLSSTAYPVLLGIRVRLQSVSETIKHLWGTGSRG